MEKPTVTAFIPFLGGFFMGEISTYLRYWANQFNVHLIIIRTNSFSKYDSTLAFDHSDGYISVLNAISPELLKQIPAQVPFIAVGCQDYDDFEQVEAVYSDHKTGMDQLFAHLNKLGHRKIGYLGDSNIVDMRIRFDIYKENISEYGMTFKPEYAFDVSEPSMDGGREAGIQFLRERPDITALITSADLMALGFIQAISKQGISCPQDIAITGYEATTLGRHFKPSLSSVNQHMCEVIEKAFERIKARLNGEAKSNEPFFIKQELYLGNSCGESPCSQMPEQSFIEKRSSNIKAFQSSIKAVKNNESLFAFAKAGFESLVSTSFLFGPFMDECLRAKWQHNEDKPDHLYIDSFFDNSGIQTLFTETQFKPQTFPPMNNTEKDKATEKNHIVSLLPITAGETDWEVIALKDTMKEGENYENIAYFNNYLDMICFSLERDAFSVQVMDLNSTLEKRVAERTQQINDTNKKLQIKNEALKKNSQYKSDFLANMSHELRTPLNSIVGYTRRLLRKQANDSEDKTFIALSAIDRNAALLVDMINDVLDVAKMERGNFSLKKKQVDLTHIISGVVSDMQPIADKKNLRLYITNDSASNQLPTEVDPLKIGKVLTNLISNSIKYTDTGEIAIEFGEKNHNQLSTCYFFSVTDTGIGIPSDEMDKLFSKFARLNRHHRSDIAGTGLGLAIVKELVILHKGAIEVDSTEGKGSCFSVYIPKSH